MENNIQFSTLPLGADVMQAIAEMGFENATPIQSESIPVMLQGHDLIGQAQTGTGKTAAFGIPLLETIDTSDKAVKALILCPTRELCVQISEELQKMSKYKRDIKVLAIYGGDSYTRQINGLKKGANIVVGTPGRVMDHIDRKTLKLQNLDCVVLDEADEMLNMGFREDIESILSGTPDEKQTVMFSATMSKPIMEISKKFLNTPKLIKVTGKNITASTIEQAYFETRGTKKAVIISRLIQMHDFKLSLVFCNTKARVDMICDELREMGHKSEALHGDLSQNLRNQVMSRFKKREFNVLVATDVAARGLDVNNVDAVFNYDLPFDTEYYVHRIGRTGRAGKTGKAYSFAETRKDDWKIRDLEKFIKSRIEKAQVPAEESLIQARMGRLEEKLLSIATENNLGEYEKVIQDMYQRGFDAHLLATCLLKSNLEQQGIDLDEIKKNIIKEKTSKPRAPKTERSWSDEPKVKLHLALGKKDRVKPGDIVGALTGECKIKGNEIGVIDMFDHFSFFEVSESQVNRVLKGMKRNTIKGKKAILTMARN